MVADSPGMGKSTTLVSLSGEYKKQNLLDWIIRVNLRDFENAISELLDNKDIDVVADFLSKADTEGIKHPLAKKLLKHRLSPNSGSRVLLLLDGFDEIRGDRSNRQDKVVELLKFLKSKTSAKVLITTRSYAQETRRLEDELSVLSYDFNPITDERGKKFKEFIERFWRNSLRLKYSKEDLDSFEYQEFAEALFDKSRDIFGEKEVSKFIGIPLQLRMLSEAYLKGDKGFEENRLKTKGEVQALLEGLNISDLYENFVDRKYEIYFDEKNRFSDSLSNSNKERLKKSYHKDHMRLAFKYYFADEPQSLQDSNSPFYLFFSDDSTFFANKIPNNDEASELSRIGVVQIQGVGKDYKIDFIHRTFAEYFVSELIFDRLQKKVENPNYSTESKKRMWEFLLNNIFIQANYNIIRNFINSKLFSHLLVDFEGIVNELLEARISQLPKEETQLHVAAKEGLLKIALFLLKNAPSGYIDAKVEYGDTSLHYAVRSNNIAIIKGLLNYAKYLNNRNYYQKFINVRNNEATAPLHLAASRGQLDVVRCLVENDANVNVREIPFEVEEEISLSFDHPDFDGYTFSTPILCAVNSDVSEDIKWEIVKDLLKANADINIYDINYYTVLHHYTIKGYLEHIKYLIEDAKAYLDFTSRYHGTPLHIAASNGRLDIVEYLVEKGAYINSLHYKSSSNSNTPIYLAANHGHWQVVKYLLEKVEEVVISDNYFSTTLHLACRSNQLDIVLLFLQKGGVNCINMGLSDKMTPLHYAAQKDYSKIVQLLLEKGAYYNVKDQEDRTPLDLAKSGSVKNLLSDIDKLFKAVQAGKKDEVDSLLKGKDSDTLKVILNARNTDDKTLIDVSGDTDIAELLKEKLKLIQPSDRQQESVQQGGRVSVEECLPSTSSGRSKREAIGEKCLFIWEDVDEFNEEKDEKRDLSKIKIDSEKFVSYIKDLPEEKQSQLIQLASEVKIGDSSQGLVSKLIGNQKVMNHLVE